MQYCADVSADATIVDGLKLLLAPVTFYHVLFLYVSSRAKHLTISEYRSKAQDL
jgi:hypothetical protein